MSKGFYTQDEIAQLCQAIENSKGIPYLSAEENLMPTYEHPGFISINYENKVQILATPLHEQSEDDIRREPIIAVELHYDGQIFSLPPLLAKFKFEDTNEDAQIYIDTMSANIDVLTKLATVVMNSEAPTQEDVLSLYNFQEMLNELFSDEFGIYKVGVARVDLIDFVQDHIEHFNAYPGEFETPNGLVYPLTEYMKAIDSDEKEELLSQISRPH